METTTIGLDLGKNVIHAVAVDSRGRELWRKRFKRAQLLAALAQQPVSVVAMECGGGAQYVAREVSKLGHEAKLIPPQHVSPYRSGNKHDYNDALAITEASGRKGVRTVPIKSVEQQDVQALHRIRSGYVRQRTALINQWRGLVAEYGYAIPKGVVSFKRQAPSVLMALEEIVSARLLEWLQRQLQALESIGAQIEDLEKALREFEREDARAGMLSRELSGVGTLTATGLVARIGDGGQFRRGRECSAWVGLVPGQHSTGGKTRLLGISKRGDTYLRTLLIHGARNVVHRARGKDDPFSRWVNALRERRGFNVAAVAVANKNVRMAWALLRKQAAGEIT